jgi:RecB family exonuclease
MDDIPADTDAAYHAAPGFNQSTAWQLLSKSPRHAFEYRRRQQLNAGRPDPDHSREREIGTVVHKLLLGSTRNYVEIPHADYRKKEAQEMRSSAEASGVTPILTGDMSRARATAQAVTEQLREEFGIELDGQSELELLWQEDGLPCKAKLDHIRADGVTILDLKTGDDANPRGLVRRILTAGCHVQAAAYSRALAANHPDRAGRITFVDIFCETSGLVLCTPVEISGALLELGERQWLRACRTWATAQEAGYYPGYTTTTLRPECPAYALSDEMALAGELTE